MCDSYIKETVDSINKEFIDLRQQVTTLQKNNSDLKAEVEKLSGRLRRRGHKYEKLSKERDRYKQALLNIAALPHWVSEQALKALNHKEK